MGCSVYIALVHHPVKNRLGQVVSTAVTNLDIHDLARTAVTYGCDGYVLVSPLLKQREMVRQMASHWLGGDGRARNPTRARAFECLSVSPSLEHAIEWITDSRGQRPWVIATGAGYRSSGVPWSEARARLLDPCQGPALIVFGTGWGLDDDLVDGLCDDTLPAIEAVRERRGYNHLPVRAAVSIVLDRLLGDREATPS